MPFSKIIFLLSCLVAVPARADQLDPLVVTSDIDKQSAPLINAPGNFEGSEGREIRQRTPRTLDSVSGNVPGVEFTGGPRAQAQIPQIRGLDSQRILMLEDGVRQNFVSGHNGRVFGDYSLVENFEVVKGPWSALYGSGAMGGVMSFRRSKAIDLVHRHGVEHGVEAAVDGESAARGFGQRVTGFARRGWFEPLLSFRHYQGHDVRLGNGEKLEASESETRDWYSSLGFGLSEAQHFTLKLNRFEDRAQVPLDPESASSTTNELGDYRTVKQDAVGDYVMKRGRFDLHAKPFWRRTQVDKVRVRDDRKDSQIVETTGMDIWGNGRFAWSEWARSTITLGVDQFRDRNEGRRNGGPLANFPDGESKQAGIYLQPSTTLGPVTLTPGVRYDSFSLNDASGISESNSEDEVSFKGYATYEYSAERSVFAGWSQAFNAPRLQDLYVSGFHFPGNFFIPNPDLKPERAETWEVGTKNRFRLGADRLWSLSATYFRTEARDFIARSVGATTTQFENVDRVRLEGFEAGALYGQVSWGAGLSYAQVRSLNKGSGEPLADTMADQWIATLRRYPGDTLTVGTDLRFAESQRHVPANAAVTPGYFVQDVFADYDPGKVKLQLRLNNVHDRDYRPHTSALRSPGRDWRVNLTYLF